MEIIDFEPIKGCKHPLIASGATPIRSAGRAPDETTREKKEIQTYFLQVIVKEDDEEGNTSEPILKIFLTVASGPMKMEIINFAWKSEIIKFIVKMINNRH
jgi:hypothetical protein